MFYILENSSAFVTMGPFVDDTEGTTPETGLAATMNIYIITAGVRAARDSTDSITHLGDGYYSVPLNATDTAPGSGTVSRRVYATAGGALPVWSDICVVDLNFYGAMNGSDYIGAKVNAITYGEEDYLDNMVDAFDGTGYTFPNSVFPADVVQISGDATAADNAEKSFDGTGWANTNNTIAANVIQIAGSSTAAANLSYSALAMIYGEAAAGTLNTTTMTTTFTAYANDELNGRWVFFLTGDRTGEARQISDYANTGGTITLASALTGNIADGDTFLVI